MSVKMIKMIVDGIKEGKYHIIFCKPLADFHLNLAFCPYREECEHLEKYIKENLCSYNIFDLITQLHCGDCPRNEWIIVLTTQGSIFAMTVSPDFGKELDKAIKSIKF